MGKFCLNCPDIRELSLGCTNALPQAGSEILPVTQTHCKDHNYQQKFLLWLFKNHKQGKGEWLTTVTLLIDREPKTWSVTYYVSFSRSVDLFHYYSVLPDGLFPTPLLRLECLSKMCLCNYCLQSVCLFTIICLFVDAETKLRDALQSDLHERMCIFYVPHMLSYWFQLRISLRWSNEAPHPNPADLYSQF